MSKQTIWIIVGIAVVVVGIGVFFYVRQGDQELQREEENLRALEATLEENESTSLDLPASSLGTGVPELNPIQEANPFQYKNPFE